MPSELSCYSTTHAPPMPLFGTDELSSSRKRAIANRHAWCNTQLGRAFPVVSVIATMIRAEIKRMLFAHALRFLEHSFRISQQEFRHPAIRT